MPDITINDTMSQGKKIRTSYWIWTLIFLAFAVFLVVHYLPEIKKEFLLLEKVRKYWLVIAICAQLLTYVFAALVYKVLLKILKLQQYPGVWELFKATVISLFISQTVPSAQISGNTYIFGFIRRFKISSSAALSIVLTEPICFYIAIELLFLSSLVGCTIFYKTSHVIKVTLTAGMLVFLTLATIMIFAGQKKFINGLFTKLKRIKFLARRMPPDLPQSEVHEIAFLKANKERVHIGSFYQLMVMAADGFTIYALFMGLGVSLSPFVILVGFLCTKTLAVVPFTPGALVLYESSMVFYFVKLGAPIGTTIIVTLIYRLLSFWLPMPFGLILYRSGIRKNAQATL